MKTFSEPHISHRGTVLPAQMPMNDHVVPAPEDSISVLILDATGLITNLNPSALKVLECNADEAMMQFISVFIPELEHKPVMVEDKLNTYLQFLSRVGHVFEVVTQQGKSWPSLLFFHEMEISNEKSICLLMAPVISERLPS